MRAVLDTNVLISALITKDTPPDLLYQACLRGEFELVTSNEQIVEMADVLARPRLQRFLNADEAAAMIENITTRADVIESPPPVTISRDPKDNPIIAAAIAGKADLLVTGDKRDLLSLQEVEGIPVVTAREALKRLSNASFPGSQ